MMMLEETLPVPTPTRFVLEAIPEFDLFDLNFTKNLSSGLPPTPGGNLFKTPDQYSIFKYIAAPTPAPQPFAPTPTPPLSDSEHTDSLANRDHSNLNAQPEVQRSDMAERLLTGQAAPPPPRPPLPAGQPRDKVMAGDDRLPTPPPVKEDDDDPILRRPSQLLSKDSDASTAAAAASAAAPARRQSAASGEWVEYERYKRSGSVDSDASSSSSQCHAKRKASVSEDTEDPELKRRKFLERNRMAASKCRQKKKMWMQELEQRADEVQQRNKALHALVSQLKEEILILKNQLLSHHNCSCNLIQQYVQTSGHFNISLMSSLHSQAVAPVPPQPPSLPPSSQPPQQTPHPVQHPHQHHHHQHHPHPQYCMPPHEMMYA